MTPVQRALTDKSWLAYSSEPFAGCVHDFTKPIAARLTQRRYTGPYYWTPAKPGGSRGFCQASKGLHCGKAGSVFDLRLENANDHLGESRLRFINGYYADNFQDSTLSPIVARLPHGRGFLAGWTMGNGMCAAIDLGIWNDIADAARAAHDMAQRDAENERNARDEDAA